MSEYSIRVLAQTQEADRALDAVDKKLEKITKDQTLKFKFPDLSGIGDTFNNVANKAKAAADASKQVYEISKKIPGPVGDLARNVDDTANRTRGLASSLSTAAGAARENANAQKLLSNTYNATASAGMRMLNNLAQIGFALYGINQITNTVSQAFGGLFNQTIGREAQFQATLLKTQTTLASTSKVLANGTEIVDPFQKIVTLTGAIEQRIDSIRLRAIDLAGVTSNDVVEVFGIVASQIGQIGGGLKEAEDLAINFAAALGTFGIPLYQARQEVGSILRGDITMDSYLAKALGITNEDIAKARTQAGGVVKFLEERLKTSVAGQQIAAQSLSGVWSNIQDIQELVSQALGKGMLEPIIRGLAAVYDTISNIKEELFAAAGAVGDFFGGLMTIAGGTLTQEVKLFQINDADIKKGIESVQNLIQRAVEYFRDAFASVMVDVSRIINVLTPTVLKLGEAFATIAKAVVEINVSTFVALATTLANVLSVVALFTQQLANLFNLWARFIDLPIVEYIASIAAQLALLRSLGLNTLTNLYGGFRLLTGFVIPATVAVAKFVATVLAGMAAVAVAVAKAVAWFAGLVAALARVVASVTGFQTSIGVAAVELEKMSVSAGKAGANLQGLSARMAAAGAGAKGMAIGFGILMAKLAAFQLLITVVIDAIGQFQRQAQDAKNWDNANKKLAELETTYRNVGIESSNAEKSAKQFAETVVNQQYDDAIRKIEELRQKIADLRRESDPSRWSARRGAAAVFTLGLSELGNTWSKMRGQEADLAQKQLDELEAFVDRVNKLRDDQDANGPDVSVESAMQQQNKRAQTEKAIADLQKSVADQIFQAQQQLAQKQLDVARMEGEIRIRALTKANNLLLKGEEGRSAAALKALNDYIETRERAELDIETAKKQLALELMNVEKTIADYRLQVEERIAAIRQQAAQGDMAAAGAAGGASTPASGGVANVLGTNKPGAYNWNQGLGAPRSHGPHQGQDLGLDVGQKIFAIADGVVRAIIPKFGQVGQGVVIDYAGGNSGRYGHVNPTVKPGDRVKAGQQIAVVTPDGQNTHLHYERRTADGRVLDPTQWLRASLAVPGGVTTPSSSTAAGGGAASSGGLPVNMNRFLNFIAEMESAMDNKAVNPTSGAAGRFQFTPITLQDAEERFSISRQRILSNDFTTQKQAVSEFIQKAHKEAYDAILAGNFSRAEELLKGRWSALRGGVEAATGERRQRGERFLAGAAAPAGGAAGQAGGAIPIPEIDTKPYEQAMRGYAAALQRVQQLQAQISEADTKDKLKEVAKALYPERELENYDNRLIELSETMRALADTAGEAYDPEMLGLMVDRSKELRILERERAQLLAKAAQLNLSDEERKEILEDINRLEGEYVKKLDEELKRRRDIIKLEREVGIIQGLREETSRIGTRTSLEALNLQAGMIGSTLGEDPLQRRLLNAEVEILQRKIELEKDGQLLTAEGQAKLQRFAEATRSSAEYLGKLEQGIQAFMEKRAIARDLSSGMADAQKGFLKSLLTGGDLKDSLTSMLEAQAGRFIDVALEQAFKPIEKAMEANFNKFLGSDDPQKAFVEANTQALSSTTGKLDVTTQAITVVDTTLQTTNQLLQTLNQSLIAGPDGNPLALPTLTAPPPVPPEGGLLGATSNQAAAAATQATQAIEGQAAATVDLATKSAQTPPALGGVAQAMTGMASVAVSAMSVVGGVQMMGEGGTYNTLMGLAGIFGGIGSAFLGGFGGFFANGGFTPGNKPIIVGEQGPELFFPSTSGEVLSNKDSAVMFRNTRNALTETKTRRQTDQGSMMVTQALSTPIDLRYESTVINNQEFVTVEQHRKGMRESAMQGRNMTMQALQYSVRARKRVGM